MASFVVVPETGLFGKRLLLYIVGNFKIKIFGFVFKSDSLMVAITLACFKAESKESTRPY